MGGIDGYVLATWRESELRAIEAEWGLPPHSDWHMFSWPAEIFDEQWRGYVWSCLGLVCDDDVEPGSHPQDAIVPNGHFRAYRVRGFRRSAALFFEKVFHADRTMTIGLRGVLPDTGQDEAVRAWPALQLVDRMKRNPGGRRAELRATYLKDFAKAMRQVADYDGIPLKRVTWQAIADNMALTVKGVEYRRKKSPASVPEITLNEVIQWASTIPIDS